MQAREHQIDQVRGPRRLVAIGVSRSTGDGKRERKVAVVGTSREDLAAIVAELDAELKLGIRAQLEAQEVQ